MKARIFKQAILVKLLLSLLISQLWAQGDHTKKFSDSFKADRNTSLTIENKYGNVDINDWDQPKVDIKVVAVVDNVSQEKAERILSYINVEFSQSGDEIKAITQIDDRLGRIRNGNHKFEINYTVNMPKDISIDLFNKYGSVFITELTGQAHIDVKYGNLKANSILRGNEKPLSEITLAYSDGSIEEASWLKSDIKYSKLDIERSQAIILYSKYSKVYIDEASSIVAESKYDVFEMGSLSNFVINTKYSNIKIDQLSKKLECETEYTDCKIDYIPPEFEQINISNKYGSYKLGIDADASYQLEGYAGYAKISYHETGQVSRIAENTSMKVNGYVGTDAGAGSSVKISTKYGGVRLDY